FLSCSYGFRPNRRAQDAVAEIHGLASAPKNFTWVLEADIAACFDEIDHTALMERLRGRIKDKRTNSLVKSFLKSRVMNQSGDREDTITGTPQGGVLSPLLANIAGRYWTSMSRPSGNRMATAATSGADRGWVTGSSSVTRMTSSSWCM